ncbi:hypothetical protein GUITHDRAFT_102755 [Guillardia theta CCMP2712]|uniref:Uncharacterized protein n=1 Tax=Guillardia theta (strain CCMP2712) TaxID=905079 RepID=L1JSR6_GUITC|nr:hypothetical protein GUITHDRAFT_102755 [Guillardia theta CCMP2712]EKX51487.1 hypothetical protein GUITHDRAFT_102755 [Guillardia theta CCMP2712]|eukprot:XP_005838467.1 hypothetical protein GUITHDRAFT_102755 [Guillardia theta CCMP2712]
MKEAFLAPDLAPLRIHLLNSIPSDDSERSNVEKSLCMVKEVLETLVEALGSHFKILDAAILNAATADEGTSSRASQHKSLTKEEQGASRLIEDNFKQYSQRLHEISSWYSQLTKRIESIDAKLCEESENLKKLNVKILQFDETVRQAQKDITTQNLKLNNLQNDYIFFEKETMPTLSMLQEHVNNLNNVLEIGHQSSPSIQVQMHNEAIESTRLKNISQSIENLTKDNHESLNQVSPVEEIINQWEVFHQSVEDRIGHAVKHHIDDLLIESLNDPGKRANTIKIIHALSDEAAYRHILTTLDLKVDKRHFQIFAAKYSEQVEALARQVMKTNSVSCRCKQNNLAASERDSRVPLLSIGLAKNTKLQGIAAGHPAPACQEALTGGAKVYANYRPRTSRS